MAGSKSDYLENALLDHVYGGPSYTRPGTVYLALFTVSPTDSGGGTEVTGGSYARLAITNDATNFPAASGGTKSNGTTLSFPVATGNWGTLVSSALFDAVTSGNMLTWGDLLTPKAITTDDTAKFNPGDIVYTED